MSNIQRTFNLIKELIHKDLAPVTNMANFCTVLKDEFDWHSVGFYLVDENKKRLYLGPHQGPLACIHIEYDKGVCGQAWSKQETLNVPDVHEYEGHIACSSLSNSELVIPMIYAGKVEAVLDIDSIEFSAFSKDAQQWLEQILAHLTQTLYSRAHSKRN